MKIYNPTDLQFIIDQSIINDLSAEEAYKKCNSEAGKWSNGPYRVCSFEIFAAYYNTKKAHVVNAVADLVMERELGI